LVNLFEEQNERGVEPEGWRDWVEQELELHSQFSRDPVWSTTPSLPDSGDDGFEMDDGYSCSDATSSAEMDVLCNETMSDSSDAGWRDWVKQELELHSQWNGDPVWSTTPSLLDCGDDGFEMDDGYSCSDVTSSAEMDLLCNETMSDSSDAGSEKADDDPDENIRDICADCGSGWLCQSCCLYVIGMSVRCDPHFVPQSAAARVTRVHFAVCQSQEKTGAEATGGDETHCHGDVDESMDFDDESHVTASRAMTPSEGHNTTPAIEDEQLATTGTDAVRQQSFLRVSDETSTAAVPQVRTISFFTR
jgi:hypothetical protein